MDKRSKDRNTDERCQQEEEEEEEKEEEEAEAMEEEGRCAKSEDECVSDVIFKCNEEDVANGNSSKIDR